MLVIFHCQASGWYPDPSVSWVVSGTTVDRGDYNTSSLQDPKGLFNSTSVLQIKAETKKGNVRILESDQSVQEGMLVIFHCQASGWYPDPSVSWVVNGTTVDRGDYNTSSLQDPNGLFSSTSVLQMKAETSTMVECWASVSAARAHQSSSLKLTVVAPNTPQDYTVVIAVIVSVCTIILLAVLILVLYYRKKVTSKRIHLTFLLKVPFKTLLQVIKPMKREVKAVLAIN
ncbi:cell surface glycoprotein MUC18-like [Sinocyclocheilus rhinocerous]|uniref:cell surface glycoprotein MUC18-like n=1 Tax=Sinocyclocheilus rhinocerous TaxID=307959 RepID=UPI0007B7E536|nr:PREDICTED: cell surface glycoprotein MUC18-like [Sinocyclocheilus rhinocerous]